MEFRTSSDSIGQISSALAKAQLHIGNASKDAKNPFFKSKYADLASVREACRKPLSENGLALTGSVICENGLWMYVGKLSHAESGEWFQTYVPLLMAKNDMQSFGSAQTYAERYAIKSLCAIATEDDDGNEASAKTSATPVTQVLKKITGEQLDTLVFTLNITDEEKANMTSHYKVANLEDLSFDQAVNAIAILEKKRAPK
jgi:hypothetical protein